MSTNKGGSSEGNWETTTRLTGELAHEGKLIHEVNERAKYPHYSKSDALQGSIRVSKAILVSESLTSTHMHVSECSLLQRIAASKLLQYAGPEGPS